MQPFTQHTAPAWRRERRQAILAMGARQYRRELKAGRAEDRGDDSHKLLQGDDVRLMYEFGRPQ